VKKRNIPPGEWPATTLVVPVCNEEAIPEQKIINTLTPDYPPEKISILFVADGSNDRSPVIVQQYPSIRLLHETERKGKYAALKRAMRQVATPVVVFSDANCMLNADCLRKMITVFNNPEIGAVAGEKKIFRNNYASAVGVAEGICREYESFM
jgi:poly-beta-1,6-N-acetyl-D-glucosamine synthase